MTEHDLRERLTRLETEVEHMRETVDKMDAKVTTLVDTLNQARGAKWMLAALVGIGGFVAGKLGSLSAFIPR